MRVNDISALRHSAAIMAVLWAVTPGCDWLNSSPQTALAPDQPRTVYALGRLEPASGIIDIRATPGDRVKELHGIEENKLAPADGILGLLSSYDLGKAQLASLVQKRDLTAEKHEQQVQLAQAQLAQALASKAQAEAKQTELNLQLGKLESLRVASELAAEEYRELEQLRSKDPELVTQHQLDKRKNQMELANEDYFIARDSHASAMHAAELAVEAAVANITAAKTAKEQAEKNFEKLIVDQEIEVAREALKRSILLAPHASPSAIRELLIAQDDDAQAPFESPDQTKASSEYTILKVFLRDGEVVTQQPIMQLGDLNEMVCIAEVHEADVKEIDEGQTVTIRSPAFSGRFADGDVDPSTNKRVGGIQGRVTRIGRIIAPPGLTNRNPLAPADRSVVEVRIEVLSDQDGAKNASGNNDVESAVEHASKHVGLQVTVEFDAHTADTGPTQENQSAEGEETEKPADNDP